MGMYSWEEAEELRRKYPYVYLEEKRKGLVPSGPGAQRPAGSKPWWLWLFIIVGSLLITLLYALAEPDPEVRK